MEFGEVIYSNGYNAKGRGRDLLGDGLRLLCRDECGVSAATPQEAYRAVAANPAASAEFWAAAKVFPWMAETGIGYRGPSPA